MDRLGLSAFGVDERGRDFSVPLSFFFRSRLGRGCGGVLSRLRRSRSRSVSCPAASVFFGATIMPMIVPGKRRPEKATRMDAARRHLATAITLWFTGGDTVSTYTLSHAAYEVIHNLTRQRRGRDLLFDSLLIRDEYRKDFNTMLRDPANFFKHASPNYSRRGVKGLVSVD